MTAFDALLFALGVANVACAVVNASRERFGLATYNLFAAIFSITVALS
jgi:hypothetical protein